jgi:hypothetical protein
MRKRHFFRRKLLKIAENCDHNIGFGNKPSGNFFFLSYFYPLFKATGRNLARLGILIIISLPYH